MPEGKPAGVRCIHLTKDLKCALFGMPERPDVCIRFKAEKLVCGNSQTGAVKKLASLEGISFEKLLLNL